MFMFETVVNNLFLFMFMFMFMFMLMIDCVNIVCWGMFFS